MDSRKPRYFECRISKTYISYLKVWEIFLSFSLNAHKCNSKKYRSVILTLWQLPFWLAKEAKWWHFYIQLFKHMIVKPLNLCVRFSACTFSLKESEIIAYWIWISHQPPDDCINSNYNLEFEIRDLRGNHHFEMLKTIFIFIIIFFDKIINAQITLKKNVYLVCT